MSSLEVPTKYIDFYYYDDKELVAFIVPYVIRFIFKALNSKESLEINNKKSIHRCPISSTIETKSTIYKFYINKDDFYDMKSYVHRLNLHRLIKGSVNNLKPNIIISNEILLSDGLDMDEKIVKKFYQDNIKNNHEFEIYWK